MGKSSKIRVTDYRMSLHIGVTQLQIDEFTVFKMGDKIAWSGSAVGGDVISINQPNLFGGQEKEGGFVGEIHVLDGNANQTLVSKIATKLGRTVGNIAGFRNFTSFFITNRDGDLPGALVAQNNPYLKKMAFRVRREPRPRRGKRSVYFCLDKSTQFGATNLAQVKSAMSSLLAIIKEDINRGVAYDVGVTLFSDEASTLEHTDCTTGEIDAIDTFIQGIALEAGKDYKVPANAALDWFTDSLADSEISDRTLVFVQDGLEDGMVTAEQAGAILQDILDNDSGDFSKGALSAVRSCVFNIGNSNIAKSLLLDNTPVDGVPVVTSGDAAELLDRLKSVVHPGSIGRIANPSYVALEILTNKIMGAGMAPASLDWVAFENEATVLYNEGLAIAFPWTQEAPFQDVIGEILGHIDGVIFAHPRTGLLTLTLIRDNYDIDQLRVVNPTNATLKSFQRKALGETVNNIKVTWTDPATEKDATTPAIRDLGNIAAQGAEVPDTRDFYAIRDRELAVKLGYRELLAASAPLASADIELDRNFWDIVPGEPFILEWPERGIEQLVMRFTEIDYGKSRNSKIQVTAIEDQFGLDDAVFETPPESEFDDGAEEPTAMDNTHIITLPYYFVSNNIDTAIASGTSYPEVFAGILGGYDGSDATTYNLYGEKVDGLGNITFGSVGIKTIIARGTLDADMDAEAQTVLATFPTISAGDVPMAGSILQIGESDDADSEMAIISAIQPGGSPDGYIIERGILDTTPKAWPAGTPFWVIDPGSVWTDNTIHSSGADVDYKLLTITSLGTLDEGIAPVATETMIDRPHLPSRPANVQIEGVGFGVVDMTAGGDPELTFATRNRLTEDATVLLWGDGAVTPEAGQTTHAIIKGPDMAELTTEDDISSPYSIPRASFGGLSKGYVQVVSMRDGLTSLQGHEIEITLAVGWGNGWGLNWGG